jgi:hypothetical protein
MRKLLTICAILLSLSVSAQWQLTGSKVRYVNGIGIPTKDTAAGVGADSSQILIRPADSSLYIKYKRTWQKVGAGGTIGGSGTTNYVPKFTASTTLGNSQIFDNGTNVGIGTASPAQKLDVNGIARVTTEMRSKNTAGNISYFTFEENTNANSATFISGDARTTGNLGLWTNSLERIRIDNNGNVGIGYTAPAAKLAVNGTTLINTNTDNGVDALQVSGSAIASTLKFNTSGQTVSISSYYNGGTGRHIWIGGGGLSSNSSSAENTAIGVDAMLNNTSGYYNSALGANALKANTTGFLNVAFGPYALLTNTTGNRNMAIGQSALEQSNSSDNVAVGSQTLISLTSGGRNVGIGSNALFYATTGSSNVAVGTEAGKFISGGSNNVTSGTSIYLGDDTRASANGNSNEIVIGHNAIGQGSNTAIIGNSSITKTFLRGATMVNTTTDNGVDELQVNGSIQGTGFNQAYTARTTTYTAANTDYFIDCTSGTFTVNLFTAVGNTGRILIIKNSGTGTITVDPNGSQTIDGATTYSLATQYATVQIVSDGTNWKIISKF